jgi:hypothetical protein
VSTPREPKREPKRPILVSGTGRNTAPPIEPFVRLKVLAPHERPRLGATKLGATTVGAASTYAERTGALKVGTTTIGATTVSATTTYAERTGALIRRSHLPEGLDARALDRVWARLGPSPRVRVRRRLASPLGWALVAIVLFVSGAVLAAQTGVLAWPRVSARVGVIFQRLTGRPPLSRGQPPIAERREPSRRLAGSEETLATPPPQSTPPSSLAPSPSVAPPIASSVSPPIAASLELAKLPPSSPHPSPSLAPQARALPAIRALLSPPPQASLLPPTATLSQARSSALAPEPTAAGTRRAEHRLPDAAEVGAPNLTSPRVLALRETTPTPERNTTLANESALLGRALARLRQQRDPAGALAELELYSARFPSGVLDHEAQSARVDALLMLGRLGEARTVLSKLTLRTGARDRELRVIRGELEADSACASAIKDFEAVLGESGSGPLAERAMWGRAACRARLGDERSARKDLADYLARFPEGAHAPVARARLRN